MTGPESVQVITEILNREKISYMVVGSFSSNYHGIPRSTKDADIVLEFDESSWSKLSRSLPDELVLDPQGSFEMVTSTRKEVLRLKGSAFEIEFFHLSMDEFDQARFKRREKVELFNGSGVWVATAEDVIVQKLRWALTGQRSKDFDDVVSVLLRKQQRLDFNYIEAWCTKHGTLPLLAEAREAAVL